MNQDKHNTHKFLEVNLTRDGGEDMSQKTQSVKHTPGPWEVKEHHSPDSGKLICGPGTSGIIARMVRPYDFHKPTQECNARLIAAAPELYEACREALALCVSNGYGRDNVQPKLHAALLKAEGK